MGDDDGTPFGRLLRRRRVRHEMTQERLAARADLSTRHVSFLETGRSNPSRESVLAISQALDLPLRERNTLLRAAGLPAAYPERDPLREDSHVRSLFEFLLRRHEPFPAYVIDHRWTVELHNRAAVTVLDWLLDGELPEPVGREASETAGPAGGAEAGVDGNGAGPDRSRGRLVGSNQLRMLFDPERLRPLTVNFEDVGQFLLDRLEEEIALHPDDPELERLRVDLEEYGPAPITDPGRRRPDEMPALPIHLRKEGTDLRLLSFLVTVAAPREVGLQELRMETFLPADGQSGELLERLAGD